jgi:muramoyltetrapeptide carboxypeptidase
MIHYPFLKERATIGVTAPSSGAPPDLHGLVKQACEQLEKKGYQFVMGETVWTQEKAKSAPAPIRAAELNAQLLDEKVDMIFPPWGGELLIEIIDAIQFDRVRPKWVMGYSDLSVLLLALTLKTGLATAHGSNLIDLRGEYSDETTAMWETVLRTREGESVVQVSSENYQLKWAHENPSPCVFHLTEPTLWKGIPQQKQKVSGRLLGGCIDVVRHLIGTPFGDVATFRKNIINGESIVWYFENCELNTADLRRTLFQMKLAGWFEGCTGILFGRSSANHPVNGYTVEDVYQDLYDELGLPIIFDIDCGHVPPQNILINGAFAEVDLDYGRGTVIQTFKP